MVALIGMASLVTDLGNGWRTRRALIAATDASALAAAQDFVNGQNGCASTANGFLTWNEAAASLSSCTPFFYNADHGRVTVSASQNVDTWFAGVIGRGDYDAESVTTAVWGPPASVTGLRPIGLCIDGLGRPPGHRRQPPGDRDPHPHRLRQGPARRLWGRLGARQLGHDRLRRWFQLEPRHQGLGPRRLPG